MAFQVSEALKTPLQVMTQSVLGRFSITRTSVNPESTTLEIIKIVAITAFSLIGAIAVIPLWIAGEVIEACTEKGKKIFEDKVDLGEFDINDVSLDPDKTEMVGTGLSTFQATSDANFCKDSCIHTALRDSELGLGRGVDILTTEGRALTIEYLQRMNANTFRFSIEWFDVIKNGFNRYTEAAKEFSEAGFKLVITLDHWIGNGETNVFENNRDINDFVKFTEGAYTALRPFASTFLTFNEINVDASQKYVMGDLPPNKVADFWSARKLCLLKLKAHSKVYDALHALEGAYTGEKADGSLRVGLSHQAIMMRSNSRWNVIARIVSFVLNYVFHESFMQEIEKIGDKLDFLGVQFYARPLIGRNGWKPVDSIAEKNTYNPEGWMVEGMRYRFDPQGILSILQEVNSRTKKPLLVTEIGSAGKIKVNTLNTSGSLENRKATYYKIAIRAMRVAQDEGIELIGSLFWTLFDNLEWQHGYDEGTAFGILARNTNTSAVRETEGFKVLTDAFEKSMVMNGAVRPAC